MSLGATVVVVVLRLVVDKLASDQFELLMLIDWVNDYKDQCLSELQTSR